LISKKNRRVSQPDFPLLPETVFDPAYPKICIVTPNFNGGKFLEETILSVINQNYPNLEYILIDGGSTDNSLSIINKYSKYFAYWESHPDNGLYHALQKGFDKSSAEIMGWINSDDVLQKKALFTIAEIFLSNPTVQWVQGYPVVIDEIGRMVYHRPHVYSKYCFYLKDFNSDGRFIQQESTFWKRTLWNKAGSYISMQYKYAGDFELWIRFFQHEQLQITDALLGAFRIRRNGQISIINYNKYLHECNEIIDTYYTQLSKKEKRFLKNVKRVRKFNSSLPRLWAFFRMNNFEKKINPPLPSLKFDFNKYSFILM